MFSKMQIDIPIIEKSEYPTSLQMKNWINNYSKEDWDKLISNKQFIAIFSENLQKATELANLILNRNKPDDGKNHVNIP